MREIAGYEDLSPRSFATLFAKGRLARAFCVVTTVDHKVLVNNRIKNPERTLIVPELAVEDHSSLQSEIAASPDLQLKLGMSAAEIQEASRIAHLNRYRLVPPRGQVGAFPVAIELGIPASQIQIYKDANLLWAHLTTVAAALQQCTDLCDRVRQDSYYALGRYVETRPSAT